MKRATERERETEVEGANSNSNSCLQTVNRYFGIRVHVYARMETVKCDQDENGNGSNKANEGKSSKSTGAD